MKLAKILAVFTFLTVVAFSASAQSNTQHNDIKKIKQGIHSGELTKKETYNAGKQPYALRKDIRIEKKKADASIYRKKHNDRGRN